MKRLFGMKLRPAVWSHIQSKVTLMCFLQLDAAMRFAL
jgi:hypothetical protein